MNHELLLFLLFHYISIVVVRFLCHAVGSAISSNKTKYGIKNKAVLGLVSVLSLKGLGLVSVSRFKGLGLARDYSIETTRHERRKK